MSLRSALIEQVYGQNSHLHVLPSLEGLDAKEAGALPNGASHSIFQTVHHMVYWQDITLARLRGEDPQSPGSASLGWQTPREPEDASDWEAAVACLAEGLRALESFIADEHRDLHAVVDRRRGTSSFEEILMLQSHSSYHLGQIVMLRQQLQSWPPPKGGDTW